MVPGRPHGRPGADRRRRGRPPAGVQRARRGRARRGARDRHARRPRSRCSASCSPRRRAGAGSPAWSSTASAATSQGLRRSACPCSRAARIPRRARRSRARRCASPCAAAASTSRPATIVVRRRRRRGDRAGRADRGGARGRGGDRAAAERAILAAIGRGEPLHDQTNYAEHVAALDRGEESALALPVDVDAEALRLDAARAGRTRSRARRRRRRARARRDPRRQPARRAVAGRRLPEPGARSRPTCSTRSPPASLRDDAAVALQYTPCEGIPSVREYLLDRQEQLQGRRPELAELIVTSGGMECITLACRGADRPGRRGRRRGADLPRRADGVRRRRGATVDGVPMDEDGLRVDALAERLADGPAAEAPLRHPRVPEPDGADAAARRGARRSSSCAAGTAC